MASDNELDLDMTMIDSGDSSFNELLQEGHPNNLGNVITNSPKPTLTREAAELSTDDLAGVSKQDILIDLLSSVSSDVSHLGLEQVHNHTIEYVDNNNKSVLLINKYLLSLGKKAIPVIAPGLAPHYMETIPFEDINQGDVILYSLDEENAFLGILTGINNVLDVDGNEIDKTYKILTTDLDKVVVIHITKDQIKIPMR